MSRYKPLIKNNKYINLISESDIFGDENNQIGFLTGINC